MSFCRLLFLGEKMSLCKHCGEEYKGQFSKHLWEKHRDVAEAQLSKARDRSPSHIKSGKRGNSRGDGAAQLAESTSVMISPKTFQMSSALLWQAREAAIVEWDWDADLSVEDFLDTYLYVSFKQRGIILGGYQVIGKEGGNGSKGPA